MVLRHCGGDQATATVLTTLHGGILKVRSLTYSYRSQPSLMILDVSETLSVGVMVGDEKDPHQASHCSTVHHFDRLHHYLRRYESPTHHLPIQVPPFLVFFLNSCQQCMPICYCNAAINSCFLLLPTFEIVRVAISTS
jgi:hypothetical protein